MFNNNLVTPVTNNVFQRKFLLTLGIYWGLSVQNFAQIRLDLTFLLYNV